jgi:hypothetical protein
MVELDYHYHELVAGMKFQNELPDKSRQGSAIRNQWLMLQEVA